MSYSIAANLLIHACDTTSPHHRSAADFMASCEEYGDLMCLTWPALIAHQRIATHPSIFSAPLDPGLAWDNVRNLLTLPRARVIGE